MGISPEKKIVRDGMEKYLLRKSFEDMLPEEIVWRRKDGFSDGVSSFEKTIFSSPYNFFRQHIFKTLS